MSNFLDKWRGTSSFNEGVLALRPEEVDAELAEIVPQYRELNTAAFDLGQPTTDGESMEKLKATDLLLLAYDTSNQPAGFATYQTITSDVGEVIYQARGLLPNARGQGFGRRFAQIAAHELRADFLIAKAQNPISIWSTMASRLFETIHPIDAPFSASPEMSQVLSDTVRARGKLGEVDLDTGVHPGSYPMGKLGDYNPNVAHPGVSRVQHRLHQLGVRAANGDAVYYGGKIV